MQKPQSSIYTRLLWREWDTRCRQFWVWVLVLFPKVLLFQVTLKYYCIQLGLVYSLLKLCLFNVMVIWYFLITCFCQPVGFGKLVHTNRNERSVFAMPLSSHIALYTNQATATEMIVRHKRTRNCGSSSSSNLSCITCVWPHYDSQSNHSNKTEVFYGLNNYQCVFVKSWIN